MGASAETGKPVAADLRRRKKSLPIVYAFQHSAPEDKALLTALYQRPNSAPLDDTDVAAALGVLERTRAEDKARGLLADHCARAMLELEQARLAPWARTEFAEFARFLAERRY